MVDYDLTRRVAPFLDVHLVIPLLEFLGPRKVFFLIFLYQIFTSKVLGL